MLTIVLVTVVTLVAVLTLALVVVLADAILDAPAARQRARLADASDRIPSWGSLASVQTTARRLSPSEAWCRDLVARGTPRAPDVRPTWRRA